MRLHHNRFRQRVLRVLAATAVTAAVTVGITACGASDDSPAAGATTAELGNDTRVIDTDRGQVTVPAAPRRIAVLSAGLAGYLFTLEAPVILTDTRVLGVTNQGNGFPPQWADKAKAQGTAALPAVETLDVEAIARADPDLIIGGGQGFTAVLAEEAYERLGSIAPTVLISSSVNTWQGQLEAVADAAGQSDEVDELVKAYDDKIAEVRATIAIPEAPVSYLLSLGTNEPAFIPPTAALPKMLGDVGFDADDVLAKAKYPELHGSGDSFIISNELLAQVGDAPTMFVVPVAGRSLVELRRDPLYSALPAFAAGQVYELPATSYRPDYDGVMETLDVIARTFTG